MNYRMSNVGSPKAVDTRIGSLPKTRLFGQRSRRLLERQRLSLQSYLRSLLHTESLLPLLATFLQTPLNSLQELYSQRTCGRPQAIPSSSNAAAAANQSTEKQTVQCWREMQLDAGDNAIVENVSSAHDGPRVEQPNSVLCEIDDIDEQSPCPAVRENGESDSCSRSSLDSFYSCGESESESEQLQSAGLWSRYLARPEPYREGQTQRAARGTFHSLQLSAKRRALLLQYSS